MGYADADMEEGFVPTTHGDVHFIHKPGVKAALLLLHGLGGTTQVWKRFMRATNLDTYAIDMLGHGASSRPHIDYTIDIQVSVVAEFIRRKCGRRPFLMGNSYGAWIALEYALRNRIAGLIIEDGVLLDRHDPSMTGPDFAEGAELLKAVLSDNNNDAVVMKSIIDRYTGTKPDRIAAISCPTLILWGGRDSVVSSSVAERLHTLIKGSTLIVLENAGHVPHFSDAAEVADKVKRFIGGAANEVKDNIKG